jgi:hypothetical protein
MYVESGSQPYVSPAGNLRCCQFWSPSLTVAYCFWNIDESMHAATVSETSFCVGQMSFRYTGEPSLLLPSGSVSKLCPMCPASAYATTSGGLIR